MIIFIKTDQNIDFVNSCVIDILKIAKNEYQLRDSVNTLGGEYYSIVTAGIEVRIENNSYDYEDLYNVTIFVKKHWSNTVKYDNAIFDLIGLLLFKLLSVNFKENIAYMNSLSDELTKFN